MDIDVRCGPDGAGQVAVGIVGTGGARVCIGVPGGHLGGVGAGDNDGRGAGGGRGRGGHGHDPGRGGLVALRVGAGVGDGVAARQGRVDRRGGAYPAGKVPVHPVDAGGPGVLVGRAGLDGYHQRRVGDESGRQVDRHAYPQDVGVITRERRGDRVQAAAYLKDIDAVPGVIPGRPGVRKVGRVIGVCKIHQVHVAELVERGDRVRAAARLKEGDLDHAAVLAPVRPGVDAPRRGGVERVGDVDDLYTVVFVSGDGRVRAAAGLERFNADGVAQLQAGAVPHRTGGYRGIRVGDVDYLDSVVLVSHDNRVRAAACLERVDAERAVELQVAAVPQGPRRGGVERVGDVDGIDGVGFSSRDYRVEAAPRLKDRDVGGAGKLPRVDVVDASCRGRPARVGELDYLDAVVAISGDDGVRPAAGLEHLYVARAVQLAGAAVPE